MVKRGLVWGLPVSFGVLILFFVQFNQQAIIGADGNLHSKLALDVARNGFLKELPQARFSWFANRYSDKDFVYHLYLIPFVTMLGSTFGTKLAAFLASSCLLGVVCMLLKRYTRSSWASWFGLATMTSYQYLRDTAEPRPFVFAILLTILGIHALVVRNQTWIFLLSFLYGMVHLSGWILPVIALTFVAYGWIMSGKVNLIPFFLSLAGWGMSFLVHPNFPNNIFYFYLNGILVPWYAIQTGVLELGAEFFPLYTSELLRAFPWLLAGGLLVCFLRILSPGVLSKESQLWGVTSGLMLLMGLVARRNMTHAYPIVLLYISLTFVELVQSIRRKNGELSARVISISVYCAVLVSLYAIWQTATGLARVLYAERVYSKHFFAVAQYLKTNVPTGSRIFHTNWSDSQYLIGLAPDFEYIVTLDPIYMYTYNKDLYVLYRNVSFGQTDDPYHILRDTFGTRYGYAGKNYFQGFIDQIRSDPRFHIDAEDELGIVFSLADT